MTTLCRVTATWRPGLIPAAAHQLPPAERFALPPEALSAAAASWQPPEPDVGLVRLDAETADVLRWHASGGDLRLDPQGIGWSVIPLLVDHMRPPCGWFTDVSYLADGRFALTGWAEAAALPDLLRRGFISPALKITKARWLDLPEGGRLPDEGRYGVIRGADVYELSAVADPLLADTSFSVRPPELVEETLAFKVATADRLIMRGFPSTLAVL